MSNIEQFRPMLAASLPSAKRQVPTEDQVIADLRRLDWTEGFWASPKMDGIRAIKHPQHGLVSRTLKPIPNKFIQQLLAPHEFNFLDGELIVGRWDEMVEYNDNQSAIMSREGNPNFTYCVFDHVEYPGYTFRWRNAHAQKVVESLKPHSFLHHLEQKECKSIEELLEYEADIVARGFEGVIMRHRMGRYKNNRSTFLEQGMIKLKRYIDAEGAIIDFEELYINDNAPVIDKLGYQKRSAHNSGYIPAGTLGKLRLRILGGPFAGSEVSVGSGLDDNLRIKIWEDRPKYLGKVVKFKYQSVGSKNLPRTPIFLGFRSQEDM